jgi:hypothetical protein
MSLYEKVLILFLDTCFAVSYRIYENFSYDLTVQSQFVSIDENLSHHLTVLSQFFTTDENLILQFTDRSCVQQSATGNVII